MKSLYFTDERKKPRLVTGSNEAEAAAWLPAWQFFDLEGMLAEKKGRDARQGGEEAWNFSQRGCATRPVPWSPGLITASPLQLPTSEQSVLVFPATKLQNCGIRPNVSWTIYFSPFILQIRNPRSRKLRVLRNSQDLGLESVFGMPLTLQRQASWGGRGM